jgi:type IV secretion system protein VirB6
VAATQRREALSPRGPVAQVAASGGGTASGTRETPVSAALPLGQSGRRRTRGRVSAGATRRDRKA